MNAARLIKNGVGGMGAERILVTGAAGFTGSHLCERLTREGYAVRALVRDPNRSDALRRCGVEVAVGDMRDAGSLERAAAGRDVIYHIAALFRPENVSRKDMWETNVIGTKNILAAAEKAAVQRFVHCSTVGVHGDIKNPPANETTPYAPGDYYQDSKTEGEKVAIEYMRANRVQVVVFRPGGIYGPGDLRFLKLFKAIKSRKFVMLGSGEILYQLIYIDDLVDGILLCGQKEQALGNVFILTGKEPITLNELVSAIADTLGADTPKLRLPVAPVYWAGFLCELLCKPLGINPPLYRRRVDFFRKNRSFDISKARTLLGFEPSVDVSTGVARTAEWYNQSGYL